MAQQVEHVLGKDEVTSSNLVSSSIKRGYTIKGAPSFFTLPTSKRNMDAIAPSANNCYSVAALLTNLVSSSIKRGYTLNGAPSFFTSHAEP